MIVNYNVKNEPVNVGYIWCVAKIDINSKKVIGYLHKNYRDEYMFVTTKPNVSFDKEITALRFIMDNYDYFKNLIKDGQKVDAVKLFFIDDDVSLEIERG